MIVLDACVLIAHLGANDPHHDRAERILLDTADQELVASPITVAEILVAPARANRVGEAQASLRALAVNEVTLHADASERLARLRAETGLKLPDCCVLLAGRDAAAQTIATFDDRLGTAARHLGFDVLS